MSTIDSYLAELRRTLRFRLLLRERLLAEAESHLHESAAALRRAGRAPDDAEREAVARFGSPEALASEAVHAAGPAVLFRAALLLLVALALYVLPLYAIPENTLPAAPWAQRPGYLTWKLYASLSAYGVAAGTALLALAAAWRRRTRVALFALVTSAAALALSAIVGTVLAVQWVDAVSGSGSTLALVLPAIALTSILAFVAVALAVLHAPPTAAQRDRR